MKLQSNKELPNGSRICVLKINKAFRRWPNVWSLFSVIVYLFLTTGAVSILPRDCFGLYQQEHRGCEHNYYPNHHQRHSDQRGMRHSGPLGL